MGGRKARSVRRCLLRPLHRPARRERQDAANVPCEGNVQCQDGSLTLYAGAKSPSRPTYWLHPLLLGKARGMFTFRTSITFAVMAFVVALAGLLIAIQVRALRWATREAA